MIWTLLLGCMGSPDVDRGTTVRVLAASSLQEALQAVAERYEAEHPGDTVELVFAGSQTHASQLRAGLQADVLACADPVQMDGLVEEGLAVGPQVFATNQLVLASSHPITLQELPDAGFVAVGTPSSPIGRYTDTLLSAAEAVYGPTWGRRMEGAIQSREPNTRRVLAKVRLGEVDVAVVYATDLQVAPEMVASPVPVELAPQPQYSVARLQGGGPQAQDFVMLLTSESGRSILSEHGFGTP